jgi:dihydroorotate dehydrogenase
LRADPQQIEACGAGGLSGTPLKQRALAVLQRLYARVGEEVTLIAAGGIETVDDVWERLSAGASLVQIYTALIYDGPALPSRLARDLAARMRAKNISSIGQLRHQPQSRVASSG